MKRDRIAERIIHRQTQGQVVAYRPTQVELAPDARIMVQKTEAVLELNCSWTAVSPFPSLFSMRTDSRLMVQDNFKIFAGARIYINAGAELALGSGYINENLNLSCFERIEIGVDVALGDNLTVRDSDNHCLLMDGDHQMTAPVFIGDHVWIGVNVTILKGVRIGDGAVIGAGAVVTRDIPPACLAVGVPARVIRENVSWV